MTGIADIAALRDLLRSQGVRTAYVKLLSPKQDNEKNQIYLGAGLDGVTNLFPATIQTRSASESLRKRASEAGRPKLEARLDLAWLDRNGGRHDAPGTRIIDYFQYPEVRMSGFLAGCDHAPDALRRERLAQYGRRILVLGTASDGKVLGLVLTELEDPLVARFPDLPLAGASGVLRPLAVDSEDLASPAELLHREITAIVRGGWHWSRILKAAGVQPFSGAQGGGYTLEALLGVAANGNKAPDRHGFEIKGYSGSRISLMTPTPDFGFQGVHPFRDFMARYGWPAQKNDGSVRFTGSHRCGAVCEATGLSLRVRGYDAMHDSFSDASAVGVELYDPVTNEVVAGWSLAKLANCWNAKHANALYIGFDRRDAPEGREYRYKDRWLVGTGTDVWKLLRTIARGVVYYDPADTIYADGRSKVRPQWRINARDLGSAMQDLYSSSRLVTI